MNNPREIIPLGQENSSSATEPQRETCKYDVSPIKHNEEVRTQEAAHLNDPNFYDFNMWGTDPVVETTK